MFTAIILTISDKGYQGLRKDEAGPLIAEILKPQGFQIIHTEIIPDEQPKIESTLIHCTDILKADLILTTGGTGFSVRDVTPEATINVSHRLVPGIPEVMRYESYKITPRAMLSRSAAGIRNRTLIINLPGSPKAVRENLEAILPSLSHGLEILKGEATDCATPIQK